MGRQIEASQFAVSDFTAFKSGEKINQSETRQRGMVQFDELVNDAKSDLNTKLGGINNVRRIRIMRDKDDAELKVLTLTFELKVSEWELGQARRQEENEKKTTEAQKEILKNATHPKFIPCVRKLTLAHLTVVLCDATAAKIHDSGITKVRDCIQALTESDMSPKSVKEIRDVVYGTVPFLVEQETDSKEVTDLKLKMFNSLDYVISLLGVHMYGSAPKKHEVVTYLGTLSSPPQNRSFNKSPKKPQNRPQQSQAAQKAPTPPSA